MNEVVTNEADQDEAKLVEETARELFADHCSPDAVDAALGTGAAGAGEGSPPGWDAALWSVLVETGLTLVSVDEGAGGSGGTVREAAALLTVAGESAAPVPLAETALVGAWLLAAAGLPLPAGPVIGVSGEATGVAVERAPSGLTVRGRLRRVPWARHADRVALLVAAPGPGDEPELIVVSVDPAAARLVPASNVAGEPRDDLELDVTVGPDDVAPAPPGATEQLARRAALARALLLAGAARRALDLTVLYVGQRVQFGRPLARFQAVQQQVAAMAGEVAAVSTATDAAVARCAGDGFGSPAAGLAIAAAKATASHAAGFVAATAHQLHGAIGFTAEHQLRLATTRLWAWRDEDGDEAAWQEAVGAAALTAGGAGLWPLITGV